MIDVSYRFLGIKWDPRTLTVLAMYVYGHHMIDPWGSNGISWDPCMLLTVSAMYVYDDYHTGRPLGIRWDAYTDCWICHVCVWSP